MQTHDDTFTTFSNLSLSNRRWIIKSEYIQNIYSRERSNACRYTPDYAKWYILQKYLNSRLFINNNLNNQWNHT